MLVRGITVSWMSVEDERVFSMVAGLSSTLSSSSKDMNLI